MYDREMIFLVLGNLNIEAPVWPVGLLPDGLPIIIANLLSAIVVAKTWPALKVVGLTIT